MCIRDRGGIPITQTTVSSFLVMVILCVTGGILGRHLQKRPSGRQVLTEKLITTLYDMVGDTMGRHNLYWAPYIGTLFLSSALGSLIGMTGFLRSATSDLSTTLTWALMTSVLVWVCSCLLYTSGGNENGIDDREGVHRLPA